MIVLRILFQIDPCQRNLGWAGTGVGVGRMQTVTSDLRKPNMIGETRPGLDILSL